LKCQGSGEGRTVRYAMEYGVIGWKRSSSPLMKGEPNRDMALRDATRSCSSRSLSGKPFGKG